MFCVERQVTLGRETGTLRRGAGAGGGGGRAGERRSDHFERTSKSEDRSSPVAMFFFGLLPACRVVNGFYPSTSPNPKENHSLARGRVDGKTIHSTTRRQQT